MWARVQKSPLIGQLFVVETSQTLSVYMNYWLMKALTLSLKVSPRSWA